MKPMKILFLAPHLSTGGMPAFLLKRIQALQKYSDVEIAVIEHSCHSLDYVVQRNQIIKLVGEDNFLTLHESKVIALPFIEKFNPNIIHIDEMSERLELDFMKILYFDNRPYRIIETCHDISFDPATKMFTPDAYAFCSPYHLDTFANVDGYRQVIEFPIDPDTASYRDQRDAQHYLGMDTTKQHVVNIGLWTKGKNQAEGLAIARKMPHVQFHFVGNQAGNFQHYWEPLMNNVPSNVTIWGERDDADAFMKAADVFMFNSTWECNPLVLREAISYGKTILARNLPQYKDMFTKYIVDIDVNDIENQLTKLLRNQSLYVIPSDNRSEHFAEAHIDLYKHAMSVIPHKNTINDYNITHNFVGQPFLEITGTSKSDFTVEFYDGGNLVHHDTIKCNHWIRLNRQYYTPWEIIVYKDGVEVFHYNMNLNNRRVYISFESSSLGDTIAWMPYVEEFRCLHNCEVIVSTFKNFLFEKEYPMLEFVAPGTTVNNIYAMYRLGWFYDKNREPVLPNTIPLQQTATNILGLSYKEIKPRVTYKTRPQHPDDRYVAIATNSTAGCKFWTREHWQEVINYLHTVGYSVVNTSLEENPFKHCAVLDDKSMKNTIDCIVHSQFFIGLSSGLSWLAWALNKEVIMISNFTQEDHEFKCHRVTNKVVCHGCWNDPQYKFDKGDWDWCPVHKGTDRQFECQKWITPRMAIDVIKKINPS